VQLTSQVDKVQNRASQVQQDNTEQQPVVALLTKSMVDMQTRLDRAQQDFTEQQEVVNDLSQHISELQKSLDHTGMEESQQQTVISRLTDQLNSIVTEDPSILLENINGIGPAEVAKLKAAGIGSVKDLALSTPDQIEAALKPPLWKRPDYDRWIRSARILARKH
jgi:predicted flap endonuclease-1-like 5' DNA nuclease